MDIKCTPLSVAWWLEYRYCSKQLHCCCVVWYPSMTLYNALLAFIRPIGQERQSGLKSGGPTFFCQNAPLLTIGHTAAEHGRRRGVGTRGVVPSHNEGPGVLTTDFFLFCSAEDDFWCIKNQKTSLFWRFLTAVQTQLSAVTRPGLPITPDLLLPPYYYQI